MLKSPYDIRPDASFAEAAHTAITKQIGELFANLAGTRDGDDIEALHDMRVASRRLRAALSIFSEAFPRKLFGPIEKQVADITDILGAVRDADVLLDFMRSARDQSSESQQVGLDLFIDRVQRTRDDDRSHLIKALNRLEKSRFRHDCVAMLEKLAVPGGEDIG